MPNDKKNRTWTLISLKLCGEADERALQELETLVKSDPELAIRLQLLEACWRNGSNENKKNFEAFFDKLLMRLK